MKKMYLDVGKDICAECSMALRRFIGGMEGVESVEVEGGKIALFFDDERIREDFLKKITTESIEKLGYMPARQADNS